MRQIIASTVNGDKHEYNEGILGRPNDEYCAWILQPESWGGAIEVSILSAYYGLEFDVVDITNAIINRFGEDKNYGMRGFLLFDGIHYDPLYLESTNVSKCNFVNSKQKRHWARNSLWFRVSCIVHQPTMPHFRVTHQRRSSQSKTNRCTSRRNS